MVLYTHNTPRNMRSSSDSMLFSDSHVSDVKDVEERLLDETSNTQASNPRLDSRFRRVWMLPITHLAILVVYTIIFVTGWKTTSSLRADPSNNLYYIPAEIFKTERKTFYLGLDEVNPFKGKPRPELDTAWEQLLKPTAFRYPEESLRKLNRSALMLKDGSGSMVTLDVYHQLHCLKLFRRFIHPEYYVINQTRLYSHIDHCLDGLRQYIMCHADAAPNTYEWIPDYEHPWPIFETQHQCINWESFHAWANEKSFDGFDPNLISHPDFHPEMPLPYAYKIDRSNRPIFNQLANKVPI